MGPSPASSAIVWLPIELMVGGMSTRVTSEVLLLPGTASVETVATIAWLVRNPVVVGLTRMPTFTAVMLFIVPSVQLMTLPLREQVPCEVVNERKLTPTGSVLVNVTPVAGDGPRLVTVTANEKLFP